MLSSALKLVRDPRAWPHLARDAVWKLRPLEMPAPEPTWPVSPEVAEGLVLFWPEKYGDRPTRRWLDPLREGLSRFVRIRSEPISQPRPRLTVIHAEWRGERHEVALDFSDYADEVDHERAERSLAYFKMQHLREGYGLDRVFPGGYVPGRTHVYGLLPRARALADRHSYSYDVYGRFSPQFAPEVRARALETLNSQERFAYEGRLKLVSYTHFLRETARSRVCVDLPGNGDICHRLIDYLAVGACVVGIEPRTTLHVPLEPGHHIRYAASDMTDLVDVCADLLGDAEAREAQGAAARDFFDRYLHRDQLAGYYLDRLARALTQLE